MKNLPKYILAVLWLIFVFADYLFHHSYFTQAISNFSYWPFLLSSTAVFSGFIFWKNGFKNPLKPMRLEKLQGWQGYILFWIFTLILLSSFVGKVFPNHNLGTALGSFVGKSLLYQLELIFIVSASFAAGQLVLKSVKELFHTASFKLISIALGFSLIGMFAFLQGLVFSYPITHFVMMGLLVILVGWQWRAVLDLLKTSFTSSITLKNINFYQTLPIFVFLLFASASWIDALKLVPVGYDGLNLYGNLARNIGYSGDLPTGIQPYNWSIFMSLGWTLFGSASLGYLLSYLPGWLALASTYRLSRIWLPVTKSWMVTALMAIVPMFVFHMGSTEKIDLGFLFIQLAILLLILESWVNSAKAKSKESFFPEIITIFKKQIKTEYFLLAIAGWLAGYAFGIKLTAFLFIFSFLVLLFYKKGNYLTFIASAFVGVGVLFLLNIQTLANAPNGLLPLKMMAVAYIVLAFIIYYFLNKKSFSTLLNVWKPSSVFLLFAFLSFSPWLLRNAATADSLSIESLISGKNQRVEIQIDPNLVPANKRPKVQEGGSLNAAKLLAGLVFKPTAVREELQRYMGYTEGFVNYLALFYSQTMNTEIKGKIYVNIGLIFFLFLPFYLFFFKLEKYSKYNWPRWIGGGTLLLLVLSLSIFVAWSDEGDLSAALANQTAEHPSWIQWLFNIFLIPITKILYNIGSVFSGVPSLFGETFMILIVLYGTALAALWYLLSMPVARHFSRSYRGLGGFLLIYVLLWLWLGNGVPWYGFAGLPLLLILAVGLFHKQEEVGWKIYLNAGVLLFMLLSVFNRFSNIEKSQIANGDVIFSFSSTAYSTGQVSDQEEILRNIDAAYSDGAKVLNQDKNAKIYRVGTFINYYINNNQNRVFEDNQLGQFESIASLLDRDDNFIQVLKSNGFKYILFNPNDIYFDQTPEQTFRKKFDRFWQVINRSPNTRVVSTNNVVYDPSGTIQFRQEDGRTGRGRYDVKGKVVQYGTLAVVELVELVD